MQLIRAHALPSLCPRADRNPGRIITVGVVQTRWHPDAQKHRAVLAEGITEASRAGAQIIFLQELTMLRYLADKRPDPACRSAAAENLVDGPSVTFMSEQARRNGVFLNGSLFERRGSAAQRGYNTSVLFDPHGGLVHRTRKMHIPVTTGYYEDEYFAPGPARGEGDPYAVVDVNLPTAPKVGLPTCWDEWFPEVARIYGMRGAEILAYPTAIGSEPDYPGFDTEPLWEQVIRGNGIANGLFMVVANRYGYEGRVTFYGSSFIADPFGRVLARAPRAGDAVLVADLDLEQRDDWLRLFPFYATRRPESYVG